MLRPVLIALLMLFLLPACRNAVGVKEKVSTIKADARHFKNSPLAVDTLYLKDKPSLIQDFYHANSLTTVWYNNIDREALLLAINNVEPDGLQPADYNRDLIVNFENNTFVTQDECVQYDILLTETFYKLANHLFKGKVDAKSIYDDWDLKPKKLNVNVLLTEALKEHTVGKVLDRCRPPHPIYASLRNSYKYLATLPDDAGFTPIAFTKTINLSYTDSTVVPRLKKRLAYWKDLAPADTIGIVYDKTASNAVKKFQERHGLPADGKVDRITMAQLNITKQQRMEQLIVNLERWKWFAYDFGDRAVIINIPDYWLAVVKNNKDTVQVHKVVVGKPERRTPVLESKFNYLVINPTWTVPPTILKEDLTPSATEDRSYFAKHNMKIYDYSDKEINPQEWNPEEADKYKYVQGPGEGNSLGEIKFNFNNNHAVYLHDTNHREFFKRSHRALSSGCVRVQNPLKLAGYMLDMEDNGWTEDKIKKLVAAKETKNLNLENINTVHQLYWTAWMDKNGLQFRTDIYNLDKILYEKLRN
jgi:murein L,D-transpeptidase YcbB/YkuD